MEEQLGLAYVLVIVVGAACLLLAIKSNLASTVPHDGTRSHTGRFFLTLGYKLLTGLGLAVLLVVVFLAFLLLSWRANKSPTLSNVKIEAPGGIFRLPTTTDF
jgi:hypothetical protein